ncbi:MAG: hypothetical protein ACFCUQ_04190 [Kiloniellales bacterium]
MEALFSKDYGLLWAVLLALALFLPVRQLLWVLYVRRAQKTGEDIETAKQRLKRRASFTAGLLCFVFAYLYTNYLFQSRP